MIKSQQGKRKSQGKQKEDSSIRKRALFNKENVIVIAPSKRHKHVQGENVIDIRELAEQSKDVTKESGFGLRTIFRNIQQKYYEILVNYRAKQAQKLKNQDIKEFDKKYRQAVEASDARNAEWLNEQHKLKEAEYAKLFDEADIREGERILDAEAASRQAYIKASDTRNAEWLNEQRKVKEADYAKLFDEADIREGERILDAEAVSEQAYIKASNAHNKEWTKEQHDLKEKGCNKLFEKLPEDSKTEESQNIEQFNEEMRRYLQDNGLGLVKSNKLGKDMPPSYRKTGAMIPDSIEKLKFIFKKLRNRNHVLRQKNHIIYKRMQKGCWDKDAALKTRLLVYPEEVQKKMHEKRYHQMSGWTDAQWDEAKITRKDFMENKGKYILEELGLD